MCLINDAMQYIKDKQMKGEPPSDELREIEDRLIKERHDEFELRAKRTAITVEDRKRPYTI